MAEFLLLPWRSPAPKAMNILTELFISEPTHYRKYQVQITSHLAVDTDISNAMLYA